VGNKIGLLPGENTRKSVTKMYQEVEVEERFVEECHCDPCRSQDDGFDNESEDVHVVVTSECAY